MLPAEVEVESVGRCFRRPLGTVSKWDELTDYVGLSGFDSLDMWVEKIRSFIKPGREAWLYEVTILADHETTGS